MNLPEFIGHLHPVLVHLPIGILLTAILFDWLSVRKGFRKIRKSVRLLLLLGFISAAFSSFTGYMLSQSGDYDPDLLSQHQWLGISVTILTLVILLLRRGKEREMRLAYSVMLVVLAVLIMLTGHAGGTLTHGPGFLQPPPVAQWFGSSGEKKFATADLASASLYGDLVAPVFQAKCTRCHGASRQKGKLRLDEPEFILKGGEDGVVITKDAWENSDLLKRIHLEVENDDHMPPKDKAQLTKSELAILTYWIRNGADFNAKLASLPKADSMIAILSDPSQQESTADHEDPLEHVAFPDQKIMEELKKGGVVTSFLRQDDGLATFSFINADTSQMAMLIKRLPVLAPQVAELKLNGCHLTNESWKQLSQLTSLRRLYLENSNVTDADLTSLQSLPKLEYINLVGTAVTLSGIEQLKGLPALKRLYLFGSGVANDNAATVRQWFPKATVDFGNYQVPTLPSDTTVLTKPFIFPK